MNILYIDYTLLNKSLDIYVAGCSASPRCTNCHNIESHDFKLGSKYNEGYLKYIQKRVKEFDSLIDNIMIFGGEPLDQNINELVNLLFDLKFLGKKIWLFTRYEINEIPHKVKFLCDYIKTGRYIEELKTDSNIQYGIKLATSNQKIIKMEDNYKCQKQK